MARSVLLVSSERADLRVGLHPLARAMVSICDRVTHAILQPSAAPMRPGGKSASSAEYDTIDGVVRVRCPVAPLPSGQKPFERWLAPSLGHWARQPCASLDHAASTADLVVVQSGEAAAMLVRLRRNAPAAKLVYLATEPIGTQPSLGAMLIRHRGVIDCVATIIPGLSGELSLFAGRAIQVPFPFDPTLVAKAGSSPYRDRPSIVVVGSGVLDAVLVQIAAASFPQASLVLIGDVELDTPPNVRVLGPLSPSAALPFLVHADAAVVAQAVAGEPANDVDVAQKLAIFDYLGIPVACPAPLTEKHPRRYGYDPGRTASVRDALARALAAEPKRLRGDPPTWDHLAHRLVQAAFQDRADRAVTFGRETAHAG